MCRPHSSPYLHWRDAVDVPTGRRAFDMKWWRNRKKNNSQRRTCFLIAKWKWTECGEGFAIKWNPDGKWNGTMKRLRAVFWHDMRVHCSVFTLFAERELCNRWLNYLLLATTLRKDEKCSCLPECEVATAAVGKLWRKWMRDRANNAQPNPISNRNIIFSRVFHRNLVKNEFDSVPRSMHSFWIFNLK